MPPARKGFFPDRNTAGAKACPIFLILPVYPRKLIEVSGDILIDSNNPLTAINAARKLLRKGFIHEQHIPLAV